MISRIIATLIISAFTIDRLFSAAKYRDSAKLVDLISKGLFIIPFATFIAIGIGSYVDWWQNTGIFNLATVLCGSIILLSGIALRKASIQRLGSNWSSNLSPVYAGNLVNSGVYSTCRHPYSISVIAELSGLSIIFTSKWALVATFGIQLPLLIARVIFEEKYLCVRYGESFIRYKNSVPAISFNLKALFADGFTGIYQLIDLIKVVGVTGILKILLVHQRMVKYAGSYMTYQCLIALSNLGVMQDLKNHKSISIDTYTNTRHLNTEVLQTVLDYLFQVKVLDKSNEFYSLSREGHILHDHCTGIFDLMYGYAPIFENLEALMNNRSKYGVDIRRRDRHMAKGSTALTRFIPFPVAKEMILEHKFKSIADMGCGDANFLRYVVQNTSVMGIGIEISEEVIQEAEFNLKQYGLEDRIRIKKGDLRNPAQLKDVLQDAELICVMYVLHEILTDDIDFGIKVMKEWKTNYPNRQLLICELTRQTNATLRSKRSGMSEHHLFHQLSDQRLLSHEQWERIFVGAGYTVKDKRQYDFAGQIYYLLQ